MSLTPLLALTLALAYATLVLWNRRREIGEMAHHAAERKDAKQRGSNAARLQYPEVDLAKCIGCGACVRACPEEGVLELIHGQAIVVHGARCVGHGACATECPTGGVVVRIADLETRRDIPTLTPNFESTKTPGLYLAGEVTGFALIKIAIEHGTAVAQHAAQQKQAQQSTSTPVDLALRNKEGPAQRLDLLIVGAGPAGIACALEAKSQNLRTLTIDQDQIGGTVAHYPRKKLVLTQPVELPRYGKLKQTTFIKEELIALWHEIITNESLPIETGLTFEEVEQQADASFLVTFSQTDGTARQIHAQKVCLALGRRGTPRKLEIPGEELPKVCYSLVDAEGYAGQKVLVVGGGDSAVEAAIALAEQPDTQVTISYRKHAFFRIKAKNEARLAQSVSKGNLTVVFESNLTRITENEVELTPQSGTPQTLPNDEVFILAGGNPPFPKLERAGISFDPADRPASAQGTSSTSLLVALAAAFVGTAIALAWVFLFRDYYSLGKLERPAHDMHRWLSPSAPIGLGLGIAAAVLVLVNLAYLARKSTRLPINFFSLQSWMTSHIATGLLAFVLALLHAAMAPKDTVGGHALLALGILLITGGIGRYFYAFIPRAANGRDMQLDEVRSELAALTAQLNSEQAAKGTRALTERIQSELDALIQDAHWERGLASRIKSLFTTRARLAQVRKSLASEASSAGLPAAQIKTIAHLMRRAQRTALAAAHFEDLRGLLSSWRYLHRWIAVLMIILVGLHIAFSLRYSGLLT